MTSVTVCCSTESRECLSWPRVWLRVASGQLGWAGYHHARKLYLTSFITTHREETSLSHWSTLSVPVWSSHQPINNEALWGPFRWGRGTWCLACCAIELELVDVLTTFSDPTKTLLLSILSYWTYWLNTLLVDYYWLIMFVLLKFKLLGARVRSSNFSENLVISVFPSSRSIFGVPSDCLLFIIIQTRDEALFFFKTAQPQPLPQRCYFTFWRFPDNSLSEMFST